MPSDVDATLPRDLSTADEVEFSGRVPRLLRDEFKDTLPFYGANNWFVTFALEAFLEEIRNDHTLKDRVAAAIGKAVKRGL